MAIRILLSRKPGELAVEVSHLLKPFQQTLIKS